MDSEVSDLGYTGLREALAEAVDVDAPKGPPLPRRCSAKYSAQPFGRMTSTVDPAKTPEGSVTTK
jgi:hypothetical protein